MSKLIRLTLVTVIMTFASLGVNAQVGEVGIKSNLLYDATGTVNAGIEIGLAPRWSLDISGNIRGWMNSGEQTWKHWLVQPEIRYWFCDVLAGHFIGVHGIVGQFNWGNFKHAYDFINTKFSYLEDHRAQGWGVGLGIAYGYSWVLGKHWNLEAEIGVGFIRTKHDVYTCGECAERIASDVKHTYYGPTKAAINLVYVF